MNIGGLNSGFLARSIGDYSRAISRSLARLASGQQSLNATDSSLVQQLDSKIRGLRQQVLNANQAIGLLRTGESALSSQLEIVSRMRELAVQASNDLLTATQRATIAEEMISLRDEFERIATQTDFNGIKMLNQDIDDLQLEEDLSLEATNSNAANIFTETIGTGTFSSRTTLDFDNSDTTRMELSDQNGDGDLDMIVIDTTADTVTTYFGDGTGGFSFAHSSAIEAAGTFSDSGDMNADGIRDFITIDGVDISVFYGKSDGSFESETEVTGLTNQGLAYMADVNGDGHRDIVAQSGGTVSNILINTFLNNGSGSFSAGAVIDTGSMTQIGAMAFADFDGDGDDDVVYASSGSATNTVRINEGSGNFSTIKTFNTASNASGDYELSDIDGDGDLDLFTRYNSFIGATKGVGIYRNDGSGTFTSLVNLAVGGVNSSTLEIGDLNGDGQIDVVVGSSNLDAHLVFLNQSVGVYSAAQTLSSATNIMQSLVRDINGDGVLDIISRDSTLDEFSIHIGNTEERAESNAFLVANSDESSDLIGILDKATRRILDKMSEFSTLAKQLEIRSDHYLNQSSTSREAKDNLVALDYAYETAELMKNQIQLQVAIAAHSQALLPMQMIINLVRY